MLGKRGILFRRKCMVSRDAELTAHCANILLLDYKKKVVGFQESEAANQSICLHAAATQQKMNYYLDAASGAPEWLVYDLMCICAKDDHLQDEYCAPM